MLAGLPSMPVNGHTSSSHTVFAPFQDGHSRANRISVTASDKPSAVRPGGLPDAHPLTQTVSSLSGATSVDGERPRGGGWQDKAVLTDGSPVSSQPGPDTEIARSSVLDSGSVQSQKHSDAKERLVKGAVWMKPGVKAAIESLAEQTGLSFSATAAKGLEIYTRAKLQDQQETLFEPKMQAMMRREIRSSDNRHVPFEIKNAIASEQTRILTADLYKRMLRKEGVPLKAINQKLDEAYHLARANVLNTKTPKFKNLLTEWWQMTEEQATDKQGQTEGESVNGEAGTGKPGA